MPFVHTQGYPPTSDQDLLILRDQITAAVVNTMEAPEGLGTPFLSKGRLRKVPTKELHHNLGHG